MNRREFTRSAALAPLGFALSSSVLAQQDPPEAQPQPAGASAPPARVPKTAAAYNRHPPIHELDPFAEPITFTRNEFNPPIQPFALEAVLLSPGPLRDARDWNRAYVMRLPNDRLLHNFRITAGFPPTQLRWADGRPPRLPGSSPSQASRSHSGPSDRQRTSP